MASRAPPIADLRAPPFLTLTDEILEEIFLRLPGPADLARASTACASFRSVITDRAFLRRFRDTRPPPLLGFVLRGQGFCPAQAPYPSAPLARAVADAADFSYSFVPIGRWLKPWQPRDLRQGRVLLECLPRYDERYQFYRVVFLWDLDLVVCDPLHRRYVQLPPVPHQIIAQHRGLFDFDAFLAPTGQDEEEETSFKVICIARNQTNLLATVFSSATGHWCLAASPSWSSLGTEAPSRYHKLVSPDYANGCFYWSNWTVDWVGKLLVLDARKMEFSIVNCSRPSNLIQNLINSGVAVGADGTPLMFYFGRHSEDDSYDLLHITKLNGSEPSEEQQLEKIIPLARKYRYSICGAVEGFLFLHGIPEGQPSVGRRRRSYVPNREYFSLDVKTSELKKVCEMRHDFFVVHAYFGFTPSLLKPCI